MSGKGKAPRKPWPPVGKLRIFTLAQGEFIRTHCSNHTNAELADLVNETFGTSFTPTQVSSFISNRGFHTGRDTTFKKGQRPWNDGTKGQGVSRPNSGSFKAGIIPKSRRPIGSERIDSKDGYTIVKTAEINPKTGMPWWRPKHVLLWEHHHGPVPPGHNVQFIDGDRSNIVIENLELINKAVNAIRNKMGFSRVESELKPLVTTTAKLLHATYKRKKENEK
ncbi:HNH endonuclease signature motif containing protein [Desulfoluna spongiiphila]|uniref:HNH endonuclease signature motif containing protein n=1 Tax=Desulfoluna spongiiphila TaxID=419481 RepID=UPI00125C6ECF|nr:HNH endonuclease signature motif containing protein [Desulfoluna spongiiphila]VVS95327.1 hnh nuclease [Desulfoluna spongiiphila]